MCVAFSNRCPQSDGNFDIYLHHSCSARPVPVHLVARAASCCRGLFINNPLYSALTGIAWQAAGFAGEQCQHLFMTPLMLLPVNTMTDCLTLKRRDSDLYIDTKHDLFL